MDDNGPGVPDNQRKKIFDPFFTTKKEGQGTGLGLSVVKGIINAHGGRIECVASASGGARFDILLPMESQSDHNNLQG